MGFPLDRMGVIQATNNPIHDALDVIVFVAYLDSFHRSVFRHGFLFYTRTMEEGQGRDSSPDEERHIIHDDDMEKSPTDSPDLWMPERNDDDTMFERALTDGIPTKKHPQVVSELSIVEQRKKLFKDVVKGGNETQTLSVADQYLRDAV